MGQDQSTVAQRAETTVAECSLTSCLWDLFLIGSHTMPAQRLSQPTPTSLGQRCMFRCNLPPALLVEWPGSFTCHCRNPGVEYESTHKVNSGEENSPRYPFIIREKKTVLYRLHIGHSYLTHSFILRTEEAPDCFACNVPITVKHILIECTDFI